MLEFIGVGRSDVVLFAQKYWIAGVALCAVVLSVAYRGLLVTLACSGLNALHRWRDVGAARRTIRTTGSHAPWLWLTAHPVGDVEADTYDFFNWRAVWKWLWSGDRECRGIRFAVMFRPQSGGADAGLHLDSQSSTFFHLVLNSNGTLTAWVSGGGAIEIASGVAAQSWNVLQIELGKTSIRICLNGKVVGAMELPADVRRRPFRARLRASAHEDSIIDAMFSEPRVW
ncbi:MAG: hypothetical protein KKI08_16330 [Armatimonadetes bacterium]|nr:hypothetical protein [Armatimonadota bacterium]